MFEKLDIKPLLPTKIKESLSIITVSSTDTEESSWKDQIEEEVCSMFPSLTFKERLMGCFICIIFGYFLSFGSFFRFNALLLGNPVPFVTTATLGNVISLTGSCFLTGPNRQMKNMLKETRRVASIAYISSLILTLLVAFAPQPIQQILPSHGRGLILILLMIIQYFAVGWYCA